MRQCFRGVVVPVGFLGDVVFADFAVGGFGRDFRVVEDDALRRAAVSELAEERHIGFAA